MGHEKSIHEGSLDREIRSFFVSSYGSKFRGMSMNDIRSLYPEIYEDFRSGLDDVFDNDDREN